MWAYARSRCRPAGPPQPGRGRARRPGAPEPRRRVGTARAARPAGGPSAGSSRPPWPAGWRRNAPSPLAVAGPPPPPRQRDPDTGASERTAGATRTTTIPPPAPPPIEPDPGAETSPRSAQNTLLTLGGVLLGIAAIVFAGVFYTSTQTGGRAFILALGTTLALGIPVLLARRRLTATAETIAGLGLLLVLLDGYVAQRANLAGLAALSGYLYAAVLFAMVAAVALAYRLATHLRAPQFAGLLAVQPLLPLIALHLGFGRDGLAAILALVAAQNLAAVVLLGGEPALRPRLPRQTSPGLTLSWPWMLRELAWLLFGVALAGAGGLVTASMFAADTLGEAVRSCLVVLLAAAVGVAGGIISGIDVARNVATGAAVVAVIAAVSRANAIARPDLTLILTAALAAGVARLGVVAARDASRGVDRQPDRRRPGRLRRRVERPRDGGGDGPGGHHSGPVGR